MMSSLPPHEEIIFPALSPTMETGTIARWVKERESRSRPTVLAEIETDKATVDYNATDEGFVAKILVDEGVPDVEVGSVIAIMVESEEGYRRFRGLRPVERAKDKGGRCSSSLDTTTIRNKCTSNIIIIIIISE